MVLLLLTCCLLSLPLWHSVIVLCFVVRYFMSILVLQSSGWGRESWLICLICLPGVWWWLSGSSSRCHGVDCSLWLWYFLIILTYYFGTSWGENEYIRMRMYLVHCVLFYYSFGTSWWENRYIRMSIHWVHCVLFYFSFVTALGDNGYIRIRMYFVHWVLFFQLWKILERMYT